jgi:phosphoglycolate phosphatase
VKPFLLFDFDGTIADSFHLGIKIANRLAPKYGLSQFTDDDFKRFRSLPMHKVLKELKIPFYKIPGAIKLALSEYHHLLSELEPCEEVLEMLNSLKDMQIPMALLSSNDTKNLHGFLKRFGIDEFRWVEGTSGILKKANRICQQLKKHGLKPSQVIYVGDEVRDIEAAKKCGIRVIAVTWGFQTTELLCSHNPDYLVDKPAQIVDLLRGM